ncbi:DUF2382 domain-containing protein [Lichenibacterium dinghuense]|uniref:DUF2382 domain-containing protein n=1 Tax=Lichenibacterium dinghuense TaxID=2895977 RepID=UPI001F397BC0|nr:DUF2382 domain-containing protein [Lichenibacterium sp. 6Y81]
MAKHSITAVFDTRSHAEQAEAELRSSGVSAADITLLPADGEALASAETGTGGRGFWGSLEQLFGGTDDHATYAESIRRGGIMLTVRADDDRLDAIVDILERHGSVDLDEREQSWRSEGWTGGSPLSGTGSTTSSSAAAAGSRGLGPDDPGMTAMGDASRSGTATPGVGALGAGAGALGTAAVGERRASATPAPSVAAPAADRAVAPTAARGIGAADETVKVYEERLDVGKRSVSRGKVRVRTSVVSREVSEDVTLHGETVTVDRRTIDRPVEAAALDADPFRERTIELEEFAEEAVVAKSAHLVEEIGIRKEATDRVETVSETLRSTKVDVDDDRAGRAVAGAATGTAGRFASEIRDGLDVVGSDGAHVGTVDHLDGERIKLRKSDPASGGAHHWLTQDIVASVAGRVVLAVTAAEARARWATA